MAKRRYWVWVFGEIEGLRWVLDHGEMAFRPGAASRITAVRQGDQAVLYISRGAFHNPTRDEARLAGLVTVIGPVTERQPVSIAGRTFTWRCPFEANIILPEREGPSVRALASRLTLVRRPQHWGQYFRISPIEISAKDFELMVDEVQSWASALRRGPHEGRHA